MDPNKLYNNDTQWFLYISEATVRKVRKCNAWLSGWSSGSVCFWLSAYFVFSLCGFSPPAALFIRMFLVSYPAFFVTLWFPACPFLVLSVYLLNCFHTVLRPLSLCLTGRSHSADNLGLALGAVPLAALTDAFAPFTSSLNMDCESVCIWVPLPIMLHPRVEGK